MSFPKKDPAEIKAVLFRFDTEMPEGVLLTDAAVSAGPVDATVDDSENPIAVSDVAILDARAVDVDVETGAITIGDAIAGREQQWIYALVGGGVQAKYRIRAEGPASNGEYHVIERDLPVSAKGALVA